MKALYQSPGSEDWCPCTFLGLLYGEDVTAVVRVENSLVLQQVHPSRVRVLEPEYYER